MFDVTGGHADEMGDRDLSRLVHKEIIQFAHRILVRKGPCRASNQLWWRTLSEDLLGPTRPLDTRVDAGSLFLVASDLDAVELEPLAWHASLADSLISRQIARWPFEVIPPVCQQ